MAALPPLRRLVTAVLVLTLPLLASQCSKKSQQAPAVQGLTPDQAEKFQALHDPWPDQKPRPPEQLPEDRLEALGDLALKNRNFESSLINYLQILQEHPERYDLHYKVGVIFLLSGKLEAAQKELALVLVHRPEMLQAHEAMGLVHLQGKQYPLAIDEFQYVLAQDPKRAKTHHLLGVSFLESGRPDRAILALKTATGWIPASYPRTSPWPRPTCSRKIIRRPWPASSRPKPWPRRTKRSTNCWDGRWRPRSSIPRPWRPS